MAWAGRTRLGTTEPRSQAIVCGGGKNGLGWENEAGNNGASFPGHCLRGRKKWPGMRTLFRKISIKISSQVLEVYGAKIPNSIRRSVCVWLIQQIFNCNLPVQHEKHVLSLLPIKRMCTHNLPCRQ